MSPVVSSVIKSLVTQRLLCEGRRATSLYFLDQSKVIEGLQLALTPSRGTRSRLARIHLFADDGGL